MFNNSLLLSLTLQSGGITGCRNLCIICKIYFKIGIRWNYCVNFRIVICFIVTVNKYKFLKIKSVFHRRIIRWINTNEIRHFNDKLFLSNTIPIGKKWWIVFDFNHCGRNTNTSLLHLHVTVKLFFFVVMIKRRWLWGYKILYGILYR